MLNKIYKIATIVMGFILITPGAISVYIFVSQLFSSSEIVAMDQLNKFSLFLWVGRDGSTSALPLYFGLMSIAGAYLIKENKDK
jgi:hypothetical protein